tara:strand:- start:659 stop:916 length:258 start_codon:yes stop_codon:yes gene_type:complete
MPTNNAPPKRKRKHKNINDINGLIAFMSNARLTPPTVRRSKRPSTVRATVATNSKKNKENEERKQKKARKQEAETLSNLFGKFKF